jgi:hypothetical protein
MRNLLAIGTMLALFSADMVPALAAEHGGNQNGGGLSAGNSDAGGASANSAPGGFGMAPAPLPPIPGEDVFRQRRTLGGFAYPPLRPALPPLPPPTAPYPPARFPPPYRPPGGAMPPGETPNRVMTDTRDYCLGMADEVEQAAARRPVLPPDIRVLAITGRRMCEHNLIMGGLQRLRIAWRMLATQR